MVTRNPNPPNGAPPLPPAEARRFLGPDASLTDAAEILRFYRILSERRLDCAADIERFLADLSELQAAVDETGSRLYIGMTCETDSAELAGAYAHFVEHVLTQVKPWKDVLSKKYLEARGRIPDASGHFEVFDRALRTDIEIFTRENIRLEAEDELLAQEYQTVCAAMTIEFMGQERTLQQIQPFLLAPERDLREAAWRAATIRRMEDRDRIDDIFDELLDIRTRIARHAGCPDFAAYQFRALHRFDYGIEDCEAFHAAVERHFVPLLHEVLSRRKFALGLNSLRPWDTGADPSGRPPLRPFANTGDLTRKMEEVLLSVDGELGAQFRSLSERHLLDLDSRKGKAPGGYQSLLAEARAPFIFMNAVGVADDVVTLCHESGHAVHAIAAGGNGLFAYRHAPIEFSEVASFGMEMMAGERLGPFYSERELTRARRDYLESKITLFPWICIIDAFQFWLYRDPGHSRTERMDAWLGIHERFNGGAVDWSGLRDEQSYLWQRQPHLFTTPLYYIEYGIALTGALQLWRHARNDWAGTIDRYKTALALGGSRPLPKLFEAAGLEFDFSEKTMAPLANFLRSSWLETADA